MSTRRIVVPLLAFNVGFVIMGFELLGGKILAPYFGNSIYIWGSIIGVFMSALACGYYAGGKWSLHQPNLLKYSVLLLLGCILLLININLADWVLESTYSISNDPRYGSLMAAVILFAPPAVLLGMVSPYSIALLVVDQHTSGHTAGRLYFISTIGSALGTIATSFYFVVLFEINTILYALSGLLFVSGILALYYHWQEMDFARAKSVAALATQANAR